MPRTPRTLLVSLCLVAAVSAQEPLQSTLEDLRRRLDEIEDVQAVTSEKVGGTPVQAFSAEQLDLGGHVTSMFTHMDGEASSDTGHLVSLVELFISARIDDEWSVFASPGFYTFNGGLLDNPATPTVAGDPGFFADSSRVENLFISRIYGAWSPSDQLEIQGGVVGSPHGVTSREYFIPSRTIAAGNLHTRSLLANRLYPSVVRGVRAAGKYLVGDEDWLEYDAYFGSHPNAAGLGLGGARVGYHFGGAGLTIAANYGQGTRAGAASPQANIALNQSPFPPSFNLQRGYRFGGLDVDWRKGDFQFRGEAYYSAEDGQGVRDQRALSAETTWWVRERWGVSYRYDFYDAGADANAFLPGMPILPLGHSTEHVVGVAYDPHPSVRVRLDFHHNNLPNSPNTAQYVNFSWSISF